MIRFSCFIGVDQTGAALSGGSRAKPLHCAILRQIGPRRWKLFTHTRNEGVLLRLSSLDATSLAHALDATGAPRSALARSALSVDCVFGLAREAWRPSGKLTRELWRLLLRSQTVKGYGRASSEEFFATLRPRGGTHLPRRECEIHAGANSVFLTRPFQKNIQTGTFRIWKDLTRDAAEPWLRIWPFDAPDPAEVPRPWLFEGFPSLLWRETLGLRTRDLSKIRAALDRLPIEVQNPEILEEHPDVADSAVLAIGAWRLQSENRLWAPYIGFSKRRCARSEGWILGLKPEPPTSR